MSKHIYNLKQDKVDTRDRIWKAPPFVGIALPSAVDLSGNCPPVYDQGNLGSCTAQAIGALLDMVHVASTGQDFFNPSRLFIYYFERELEGTIDEDAGASIRDGIKVTVKKGACPETMHPYIISKFREKPSEEAINAALDFQTLEYDRIIVNSLQMIKRTLAAGFPIVCGILIYESFESEEVEKTGTVPMPDTLKEELLGGHAVLIVGYDDASKTFFVRNSWGEGFGNKGYFTLPYSFVSDPYLTSDMWVIKKSE